MLFIMYVITLSARVSLPKPINTRSDQCVNMRLCTCIHKTVNINERQAITCSLAGVLFEGEHGYGYLMGVSLQL